MASNPQEAAEPLLFDFHFPREIVAQKTKEQTTRLLYSGQKKSMPLNVCAGATLFTIAVIHGQSTSAHLHWLWFGFFIAVNCTRHINTARFFRRSSPQDSLDQWHRRYGAFSTLSGIAWAIGIFSVLRDVDISLQIVVLIIMLGVIAAAVPLNGIFLPYMFAFQTPIILVGIFWFSLASTSIGYILALVVSLYTAGLLIVSRNYSKAFNETLHLQFRNEEMMLSAQKISQQLTETLKERGKLLEKLQTALAEVKQLSGLLPICSHCKKIRDDNGEWKQLEKYIQGNSDAQFTHSICPGCLEEYFPGL